MDHHEHGVVERPDAPHSLPNERLRLAFSATWHCLLGCAMGELAGVALGAALRLSMSATMWLAIVLGFVFGFALGIIPLRRAGFAWRRVVRQVLIAEGLSIAVMEGTEALVASRIPGVMDAGLTDPLFWIGMSAALAAGFLAALPVNYILVGMGFRHAH